jgi:hypothetical protein
VTAGIACPDKLFVRLLVDASTYGYKGKGVYCSISNRWLDKIKKGPHPSKENPEKTAQSSTP